jgi:thymidylate kinase
VFFENTRAAYLERAADAPNRICIIDSAPSLEATRAQVAHAVLSQLNLNLTAYL